MAFPVNGVIDDFNRANEDPLSNGSAWATTDPLGAANTCEVTANQAANLDGSGTFRSYLVADYGPDCEAFCTIATKPGTNDSIELLARLQQVGSAATWDGYRFVFTTAAGSDTWTIDKITNGSATNLVTGTATELTAGDKIGAEIIGTTLTMYHFTGGSWVSRATVTDATYTTAGKLGLGIRNTTARVDDFGGGTVASTYTKAAFGKIGTVGSGVSESETTESGYGTVGTVGSGSKQVTSAAGSTFTSAGHGVVGLVDSGSRASVFAETGGGTGGTGGTGGSGSDVQTEGVSIAFGEGFFDPNPTWTRIG